MASASSSDDRAHDLGRTEVEAHRHAVFDRPFHVGQAVQANRQHARRHQIARCRQFLTADHIVVMNAGEIDRRPLAAVQFLDGLVVILQGAHAHPLAARQPFHLVAHAQTARRHRAGHDRAVALHDERAIDRQAKPLPSLSLFDLPAGVGEGRLQLRDALPAGSRRGDDRGILQERAAHQVADLQLDDLARRLIDEVALGQGDDAVSQSEQAQDLQVLARLRHDRVVGRHHEHGQVDAGGAGQHVLDETLVAGHVHDAEAEGRQIEDGEADVDGDAAGLLFR